MQIASVTIVGLGYVGLPTALCLAKSGLNVTGYDIDKPRVKRLARGEIPFQEPKLGPLLKEVLGRNFKVSHELFDSDAYMITVGTPPKKNRDIDLRFVASALRIIGQHLRKLDGFRVVVVKSTVVPGTTDGVVRRTLESASKRKVPDEVGLVANPEFLREGHAVDDTLRPERVVIGQTSKRSGDMVEEMYRKLYSKTETKYIRTTPVNAELIKYASNAFLATKVSFINSIADVASALPGADVKVVARALGLDHRIGPHFLNAGLGYGGSCLPKDVKALITTAKSLGADPTLLEAVEGTNAGRVKVVVEMAKKHLGSLGGKRIAVLGLSFKPGTDDVRDAVSLRLIGALLKTNARVVAYDPVSMDNVRKTLGGRIQYAASPREAINGSDCCVVVTEWEEFSRLSPGDFKGMKNRFVIDGRRVLDPSKFVGSGTFEAIGLGG